MSKSTQTAKTKIVGSTGSAPRLGVASWVIGLGVGIGVLLV